MHMGEINIINDDNNYSTYMTENDVKKWGGSKQDTDYSTFYIYLGEI
jgi:hypothetical protein